MLITSQVYWNARDPVKRKPTVEKFQPHPDVWRFAPKYEEVEITGNQVSVGAISGLEAVVVQDLR